jgi:hypothetical protein
MLGVSRAYWRQGVGKVAHSLTQTPVRLAGHVVVDVPADLRAELVGDGGAAVVKDVAEHDLGSLGGEVPDVRLAHPLAPPVISATLPFSRPMPSPVRCRRQRPNACLVRA